MYTMHEAFTMVSIYQPPSVAELSQSYALFVLFLFLSVNRDTIDFKLKYPTINVLHIYIPADAFYYSQHPSLFPR